MNEKTWLVATNNPGKVKEIREILSEYGINCIPLCEAGIDSDPEETGESFYENAVIKAAAAAAKTGLPVLADDSGLSVDALGGAPGVYSSRYAGEHATMEQNIDKLLEEMKEVPDGRRDARFCCCMVLLNGGEIVSAYGECKGTIGYERRGTGGFGYNPVFCIDETRTMAMLDENEKNQMSHRGRALRALCDKLGDYDA